MSHKSQPQYLPILLLTTLLVFNGSVQAEPERDPVRLVYGPEKGLLVELFTSEGCSSCPPADAWLGTLASDSRLWNGLFPVALHVDYWDYLGWRDRYASPAFSSRQRLYRTLGRTNGVYTPGFIVDGKEWSQWFSGRRQLVLPKEKPGTLSLTILDQGIEALFEPAAGQPDEPLVFNLALLEMDIETDVRAGENRNRTLQHQFVVIDFKTVRESGLQWRTNLDRTDAADGRLAVVGWVSRPGDPAPVQVAGGWLTTDKP